MVTEIMLGIFGYSVLNLTSLKIMARCGYFEPHQCRDHRGQCYETTRSPAVVSLLMPLHWLKLGLYGVFCCGYLAWHGGSKFLNAFIRQDRHIYQARTQKLVSQESSKLKAIDAEVVDE